MADDYIRVTLPLRPDEDKALVRLTRWVEDHAETKRRAIKGTLVLRALIEVAESQLARKDFQTAFMEGIDRQIEKDGR